jgi:glycosyltransferase involved in cell wall biosynthesis
MRIGIVTGEYPPMQGGVGAYTRILALELARQGQHVSLFSSAAARESDATLHLTNRVQSWGISSLRAVRQWATDERLDVVNLQFQAAAYKLSPWIHFLPEAARDIPVVTTFHDLRFPYLFPKAGALRPWIVRRLARASRAVIVTNHEDDAELKETITKVTLIPIGSNILKTLPPDYDRDVWRAKAQAAPGEFLVAFFGLLNRSKGLDTLLDSLAQLRREGIAARLLLVGGGLGSSDPTNAAYAQELRAKIDQLGLRDCIHETGYLEDEAEVGAYLRAGDVVALPFLDGTSYRRGSLMAAIHYGCAIISTQSTVAVPSFRHGDNMLLVPAGDKTALSTALRQTYEQPALRKRLGQGAGELAHEFAWTNIARAYVRVFEQVVA